MAVFFLVNYLWVKDFLLVETRRREKLLYEYLRKRPPMIGTIKLLKRIKRALIHYIKIIYNIVAMQPIMGLFSTFFDLRIFTHFWSKSGLEIDWNLIGNTNHRNFNFYIFLKNFLIIIIKIPPDRIKKKEFELP
ncbi:hypothetical protein BpHYR1_044468 [Brachionus plicatilis]|uniref:Uncharacterized protein n=1 Tax=Brachionus plicatilis TaxID=10195 RepID=A0A3M7P3U7_BRAPC|nr:hypothetical protein BpHYR1_044468 [Brachionus plicatilis]